MRRLMVRGCLLIAALVAAGPAPAAVVLDDAGWAALNAIAASGFQLPELRDKERFGRIDHWEPAGSAGGDCEDKALLARHRLAAQGWPVSSLRLALLWTEAGEYHAVLTIDVVHDGAPATYVIDNRFPYAIASQALTRLGYRWDRRQRGDGPGWTGITNRRLKP